MAKTQSKRGRPRGIKLRGPADAQRLLNRLINEVLRGERETDVLRAVTYAVATFNKLAETAEIGKRLEELERLLAKRQA